MSITLFEPIYFHLLHQSGDPLFAEIEEMANRYRHAMDVGNRETAMAGFVDAWAGAEGAWEKFPEPVKAAICRRWIGQFYCSRERIQLDL